MSTSLQCGRFLLALDQPLIMGIVNLTDDSFSGDGLRGGTEKAVAQGKRMVEEGADILDLGAESSRPGAEPVSQQQELDRLLPVIEALRDCGTPLSIDTVKPEVMRLGLNAGADMINEVLSRPEMPASCLPRIRKRVVLFGSSSMFSTSLGNL